MSPTEDELAADHRADELRDRDRQREPRLHRHPRCIVPAKPIVHAYTDEPTLVGDEPVIVVLPPDDGATP